MGKSANIVKSSSNMVPVDMRIVQELRTLSHDIIKGQDELQETLDELDSSNLVVNIERSWYGAIKKSSIEENFEGVYDNLSHYIGKCGEALQSTNKNLSRSLELIKLLALVEKDLYDHIDDQVVSNNELKTVLLDWFKKQGINDDEVRELLETSFQRAYTLRDRINALRQEYREGISQCNNRIVAFEKKHLSLDSEIEKLISDTSNKLKKALEEDLILLRKLYDDKNHSLSQLALKKEKLLNAITESFVQKSNEEKSRQDAMYKNLEKLFASLKGLSDSFTTMYTNKEKQFVLLSEQKNNEISSLRDNSVDAINKLASRRSEEIESNLANSYKEYLDLSAKTFELKKKEICELCSDSTVNIERLCSNIQDECLKTSNGIESKRQNVEEYFDAACSQIDNKAQETEKNLDVNSQAVIEKLERLLKDQQNQFEQEKITLFSTFRKRIIWTVAGTITLSGIISYVISVLL